MYFVLGLGKFSVQKILPNVIGHGVLTNLWLSIWCWFLPVSLNWEIS